MSLCSGVLIALSSCRPGPHSILHHSPELVLTSSDRVMVLAPHPDDEVLGCGGVLQRAVAMGLPHRVVFLTYGDSNERSFVVYRRKPVLSQRAVRRMAEVRRGEAIAAAGKLGVSSDRLTFLGYPDYGTLAIWSDHWGARAAYRGILTRATAVPYADALRPGAPYKGEEILRDLETVLTEFQPTKLSLSHPSDSHPDHLALYLFTRVALWNLAGRVQPELYPYLIHFRHWPEPRGLHRNAPLVPPEPLEREIAWRQLELTPTEVARKLAALKRHRSQFGYSSTSLSSFVRPNELFGDFPIVRLGSNSQRAPASLHGAAPRPPSSVPEDLTMKERAYFVGVETHSVALESRHLVLTTEISRPLERVVRAAIHVFGYRDDQAFGSLPKLHIEVGTAGIGVYDQDRKLSRATVDVVRGARRTVVRVPLAALGDPHYVLTSARTYVGEVPLDWAAWRIIELAVSSAISGEGSERVPRIRRSASWSSVSCSSNACARRSSRARASDSSRRTPA